jgi:methylglutaconyl-CoA hydratase
MALVEVEDRERVRTITLNRPERRNALTAELIDELTVALRGARDVEARVVVLRGAGEAFCAGMDIGELQRTAGKSAEEHRVDAERVTRMFRALWECVVPTVALVQGAAIAGGTGLATIADFTLAATDAKFGYTEVRIGFVPALVSAYLGLQVGDKAARELLMTARIFGADEAQRLGLVTEVVERERLEERGREVVAALLRNSPEGLRATKQLLRAQHACWLDEATGLAAEANAASRTTADFREGVAAFLEKRPPVWR